MLRYIPEIITVAVVWYFFGAAWCAAAVAAGVMFELLGAWVKSTNASIEQLRVELQSVREQVSRFEGHGLANTL